MKNYQDSDYALNKHSGGIVYRFADKIVEVTLADYLAENPGKTESDFAALKALSDDDYLDQDRRDYRQTWKNSPFDAFAETVLFAEPSPEAALIDAPEEAERHNRRITVADKALNKLTKAQRRRYICLVLEGQIFSLDEAEVGVNYPPMHPNCNCSIILSSQKLTYYIPKKLEIMNIV